MHWLTLEKVWKMAGSQKEIKVRFCDWSHHIKYCIIVGESSNGKRLLGILNTGEKMSFSKKSKGWDLYMNEDEVQSAHAV